MEQKSNHFISIAYKLYVGTDQDQELMEEATREQPFQFISGFGLALDAFEQQVADLSAGDKFDFVIPKEQAYGDYAEEHVVDLSREIFCVDGKFDGEHIHPDAIIPLQNEDGNHFYGRVVEVGSEKVKVDLNHPLAGEDLHFIGSILENRPATKEETDRLIAHMSGGCSGGCSGCGEGQCEGCGGCH